ncbi:Fib_succ_major, fibrobacter succinogenes major paralogous domain [Spirosomataceae bacterium]
MKKYIGIILFAVFGLQSCANRDGEIIEILQAMQRQNEGLKVQISTLQNSANQAMASINKIIVAQTASNQKIDALQVDLKKVLTQLSALSTQMSDTNANTTIIKTKLEALEKSCNDLVYQISLLSDKNNIARDVDGNYYKLITIGKQIWMKENLNVAKYRNGDIIPYVPSSNWSTIKYGAWCYYNNDPENGKKYGKLYNWFAAIDSRGLAPNGWHISTSTDWNSLIVSLNSTSGNIGSDLKSTSSDWQSPNVGATNSSGFSGLPGGLRANNDGGAGFTKLNQAAWFLIVGNSQPEFKGLFYENGGLNPTNSINYYNYFDENTGASIRCVKD